MTGYLAAKRTMEALLRSHRMTAGALGCVWGFDVVFVRRRWVVRVSDASMWVRTGSVVNPRLVKLWRDSFGGPLGLLSQGQRGQ